VNDIPLLEESLRPEGRRSIKKPRCNLLLQRGLQCRGDKTPLELFLAGVRGWEAGLRRRFDNSKSNPS
jgi:hypothetical protein